MSALLAHLGLPQASCLASEPDVTHGEAARARRGLACRHRGSCPHAHRGPFLSTGRAGEETGGDREPSHHGFADPLETKFKYTRVGLVGTALPREPHKLCRVTAPWRQQETDTAVWFVHRPCRASQLKPGPGRSRGRRAGKRADAEVLKVPSETWPPLLQE